MREAEVRVQKDIIAEKIKNTKETIQDLSRNLEVVAEALEKERRKKNIAEVLRKAEVEVEVY